MDERLKTLSYRRVQFLVETDKTLESYLAEAHKRLPNIENRTIADDGSLVLECRDFVHKQGVGVFLHIAAYTPGEHASVVPRLKGVPSGALQTAAPPDGCEFMDGDTMAFVAGDHVILCSSSLHEKQAERYMTRIVDIAQIDTHAAQFSLTKVANVNKMKLIKSQGVKSINLNASLYSATIDHMERTTVNKKVSGSVADAVLAIFGKDLCEEDWEKAENMSVNVRLSYDSRKCGVMFNKERLESLANIMVNEDDDGFTIETVGGEKIGPDDIVLRKKAKLPKFGKTVYCSDAWQELATYFQELKVGGLLEQ